MCVRRTNSNKCDSLEKKEGKCRLSTERLVYLYIYICSSEVFIWNRIKKGQDRGSKVSRQNYEE